MVTDTGIDQDLEEASELSVKAQKKMKKAREKIKERTAEMVSDGIITDGEAEEINVQADKKNFDKALDMIEQHLEEDRLNFEDEEKEVFAEAFSEGFQELQDTMEDMSETLKSLEKGASRKDLIQYLRGQKSSRTKKEVEQVFDAIDNMTASMVDKDKHMARALTGYSSDLTISDTAQILGEIRQKVNSDEE